MNNNGEDENLDEEFAGFRAAHSDAAPPTPKAAFTAGWAACRRTHATPTEHGSTCTGTSRIRSLAAGQSVWVQPFAVIEDIESKAIFVDPRFPTAEVESEIHSMELRGTEAGLVATGPADSHRLGHRVGGRSFLPIVTLHARD